MMWGSLRARGVKVTRECVCQALRSIDPINVALRWPAGATRRRPYSVAGPNSLWHIGISLLFLFHYKKLCVIKKAFFFFVLPACTDSHHKLIRWRIVTHDAIDGYSRLIVYLHASTNRARTV